MFFEKSLLKGISGQNVSDPLKWSLTDDSRLLQAAILNHFHFNAASFILRQWINGLELNFITSTVFCPFIYFFAQNNTH